MIYFVSGHRDLTVVEFQQHYAGVLDELIKNGNQFVVGDCPGVDSFAIDYFKENNVDDVTVYHIGVSPMYNRGFRTQGKFLSDLHRDFTMTLNSDVDVCWIKRKRSGTYLNTERRLWLNKRKSEGLSHSYQDRVEIEANLFL